MQPTPCSHRARGWFLAAAVQKHFGVICAFNIFAGLVLRKAPSVGSVEPALPGAVEQMQPQFISRFLEGQSGVTINSVSCGDLFTTCLTGIQPPTLQNCLCHSHSNLTVIVTVISISVHTLKQKCLILPF